MNSYQVYVAHSEMWLVEIEVEAPNLKAIRKNWDDISEKLAWEVLETALSGSQLPNPPDLEAELSPELEGTEVQIVKGTASFINSSSQGHSHVDVYD